GVKYFLDRNTGKDDATGSARFPLGSAGLMREPATTITSALQHHGHTGGAQLLEFCHSKGLGGVHPGDFYFPGVGILNDIVGRWVDVITHIKAIDRSNATLSKCRALGLYGIATVQNHAVSVFPGNIVGKGLVGLLGGRSGLGGFFLFTHIGVAEAGEASPRQCASGCHKQTPACWVCWMGHISSVKCC